MQGNCQGNWIALPIALLGYQIRDRWWQLGVGYALAAGTD